MIDIGELPAIPVELKYGISNVAGGFIVYRWWKRKFNICGETDYEDVCEPHIFVTMETALAYIQSIHNRETNKANKKKMEEDDGEEGEPALT